MGRNISSAVYPEISPGAFPLQVCQIILFHKDSFCSNKWILSDSTTPTRLCLAGLRTLMWCALQTPSNGEGTAVTFAAHEKQSPQTQRTEKCFSESMPLEKPRSQYFRKKQRDVLTVRHEVNRDLRHCLQGGLLAMLLQEQHLLCLKLSLLCFMWQSVNSSIPVG